MTTVRDLVSEAWPTSDGFVRVPCPWDECDYLSHAFDGWTVFGAAEMVLAGSACSTFDGIRVDPFASGRFRSCDECGTAWDANEWGDVECTGVGPCCDGTTRTCDACGTRSDAGAAPDLDGHGFGPCCMAVV